MEQNTIVLILAVILVLGLIAINALRRHFQAEQQIRLRKMIHDERLQAMQEGSELPGDGRYDELATLSPVPMDIRTFRLLALCAGLFLVFTGLGICAGFALAADPHTSETWSIGIIPGMAGLGLLLFYRLSAAAVASREPLSTSDLDSGSSSR